MQVCKVGSISQVGVSAGGLIGLLSHFYQGIDTVLMGENSAISPKPKLSHAQKPVVDNAVSEPSNSPFFVLLTFQIGFL